jgi:hypothetical protein
MVETIVLEIQRMRYAGNGERCCAHSSAAAAHRTRKQDKLPGLSAGQTYGRTTSSVAKRVPRWHVHTACEDLLASERSNACRGMQCEM